MVICDTASYGFFLSFVGRQKTEVTHFIPSVHELRLKLPVNKNFSIAFCKQSGFGLSGR